MHKLFSEQKIYTVINIDKFKLRVKCEITFQLLWIFFLHTIFDYYKSKLLVPSKSPPFAYSTAGVQPSCPGWNNYRVGDTSRQRWNQRPARRTCIMRNVTYSDLTSVIFDEHFWLGDTNYTWRDFENKPGGIRLPQPRELYLAIVLAPLLVLFRIACER